MSDEVFLDTNILIYAGSAIRADSEKRQIAEDLIRTVPFAISAQVIQEYISNALTKPALGLGKDNIQELLNGAKFLRVQPINLDLIRKANGFRERFQVSHWDACILAAALNLDCRILYTEDLNHGQDYGGVRVVNPFLK